jgi:uncharacterized OB-fold protein
MSDIYQRTLPILTDENRHFWQGGKDGHLLLLRCQDCRWWVHTPQPRCTNCLSEALEPEPVSGKGEIETFTINIKPWGKGMKVPYTIAVVALPEQKGLRVATNIVGIEPEAVHIGMKVHVRFEQDEDVWLPMFTPDPT